MTLITLPSEHDLELNEWVDNEYLPTTLALGGTQAVRRFSYIDDDRKATEHLLLFELSDLDKFESAKFDIDGESESPSLGGASIGKIAHGISVRLYRDITPDSVRDINDLSRLMGADGVRIVMADIDPAHEEDFNSWYDLEHLPEQLSFESLFSARRYVAVNAEPKYLAIYDLDDAALIASPSYDKRTATEWTLRTTRLMRNTYRRTFNRVT